MGTPRKLLAPDLNETINEVGGANPDDRFRWLLDLAGRDLKQASREELSRLRWQILVFTITSRRDLAPEPSGGPLWKPNSKFGPIVRTLQRRIKAGFEQLRSQRRFRFPMPIIDAVAWRPNLDIVPINTRGMEQRFYAAAAGVLMSVGARLRICDDPVCARFFLSSRPKRYCRAACSQRVRTARFRQRNPDLVREWKRAAYARRRRTDRASRAPAPPGDLKEGEAPGSRSRVPQALGAMGLPRA